MTRHEIATLACKILALWILSQAILGTLTLPFAILSMLADVFNHRSFNDALKQLLVMGLVPVAYFLAAWWFWALAPRIASRMVGEDTTPVTQPGFNQESAMIVACTAVGVFLFIPAARDLVNYLLRFFFDDNRFTNEWRNLSWQAGFWSRLTEITLSLWLIFGSRGLVQFFLSMRRKDLPTEPDVKG